MFERVTRSEEETVALGALIGGRCERGDVVLLRGELGSGKTRVAQGIGRGMKCGGRVNSPTFVLVNEYGGGGKTLVHADLYRLPAGSDVAELGLLEAIERAVVVVEWPERADGPIAADALTVDLEMGDDAESRLVRLCGSGPRSTALAEAVSREWE